MDRTPDHKECGQWHARQQLVGTNHYNPGLLTGKHKRGCLAEHSRLKDNYGYNLRYINDRNMDAVERFCNQAECLYRASCRETDDYPSSERSNSP